MVPWSHGPMVPWPHGPMVPWSRCALFLGHPLKRLAHTLSRCAFLFCVLLLNFLGCFFQKLVKTAVPDDGKPPGALIKKHGNLTVCVFFVFFLFANISFLFRARHGAALAGATRQAWRHGRGVTGTAPQSPRHKGPSVLLGCFFPKIG